jgi:DNA repair protein RadA/Sms
LVEVANPSALFLSERPRGASGSVVVSTLEGARPLLVELQALVSASGLNMPRRQALGVDPSRVSLLTAVLEKKIGLRLYDRDVFVNVTGGVKIVEPAVDLGLAAALISSYHDRAAPAEAVFIGEVGLAGEIRGVSRLDVRLREAEKLGFTTAFLPLAEARRPSARTTLELIGAESLTDLMARLI